MNIQEALKEAIAEAVKQHFERDPSREERPVCAEVTIKITLSEVTH